MLECSGCSTRPTSLSALCTHLLFDPPGSVHLRARDLFSMWLLAPPSLFNQITSFEANFKLFIVYQQTVVRSMTRCKNKDFFLFQILKQRARLVAVFHLLRVCWVIWKEEHKRLPPGFCTTKKHLLSTWSFLPRVFSSHCKFIQSFHIKQWSQRYSCYFYVSCCKKNIAPGTGLLCCFSQKYKSY